MAVAISVAAVTLAYFGYSRHGTLIERVLITKEPLSTAKQELIGYSKYTDHVAKKKLQLQGDTKPLTARVTQTVKWVQHVERNLVLSTASGTMITPENPVAVLFIIASAWEGRHR